MRKFGLPGIGGDHRRRHAAASINTGIRHELPGSVGGKPVRGSMRHRDRIQRIVLPVDLIVVAGGILGRVGHG